jgi:hypothetical protein
LIKSVTISDLRGIASAQLDGLTQLTILTGPNGCGKSTVLDALLIAASPSPGAALGMAVQRRPETWNGARWVVRAGGAAAVSRSRIQLGLSGGEQRTCWIEADQPYADLATVLQQRGYPTPYLQLNHVVGVDDNHPRIVSRTAFAADNHYASVVESPDDRPRVGHVRLIDPGISMSLVDAFSEVGRAGGRKSAEDGIRRLVPNFERLAIYTDEGMPTLYLERDGLPAVPLGLAGDGIQGFVQIALQLGARTDGLALIEEPEVYQHPRALQLTASAIHRAVQAGRQVVLTTHSLELIDALVDGIDPDQLSLFNLHMTGGVIAYGRYSGAQVAAARHEIEADLR